MKRAILVGVVLLALSACRGWKATGPTGGPEPSQGAAAVEATISEPSR